MSKHAFHKGLYACQECKRTSCGGDGVSSDFDCCGGGEGAGTEGDGTGDRGVCGEDVDVVVFDECEGDCLSVWCNGERRKRNSFEEPLWHRRAQSCTHYAYIRLQRGGLYLNWCVVTASIKLFSWMNCTHRRREIHSSHLRLI